MLLYHAEKEKIMLKKTKTGSNQYIFFFLNIEWLSNLYAQTIQQQELVQKEKKSMEVIKLRHTAMKWKINNMQCIQIKGKAIFISHENFNILYTNKTKN